MKKILAQIAGFIRRHKLFTFFFVATLTINIVLISNLTSQTTDFLSCSSFDRGPLGTYALYTYMEQKKVPVSRMMLAPFQELDRKSDTGKTLIIISPRYTPGLWEWQQLLEWTKRGNRLITAGLFIPTHFWEKGFAHGRLRLLKKIPVRVSLPVDSIFPYDNQLTFPAGVQRIFFGQRAKAADTAAELTATIAWLQPGMLPLLTCDTAVLAVKQIVGAGEWIIFAHPNLFSNTQLQDRGWFDFACRLLTGDGRFASKKIIFDEYHNGYSATKSFWEMLKYYQFDAGILSGAALILLYLFFTGVRILPPLDRVPSPSRDVIPGLRSMAQLFFRFSAFDGLVKRELAILKRHFTAARDNEVSASFLVQSYASRAPLPHPFTRAGELEKFLVQAEKDTGSLTRKEKITLFNTILFMRKELSL